VTLVVLLGGARSGKSAHALSLARDAGGAVTFIATGEALDEEMRERIERHRGERPDEWDTVEAPVEIASTLAAGGPVVVDCLTLWVANLQEQALGRDEILRRSHEAAAAAAARPALTVVVTNEVGLGIVPATPLGREYRDLLGEVNRIWVDAADEAWLVVAGRRLRLE
jgi:adenosyl cobinamide kinase/adenosyl cobinamide phosphate guanylyltransferase